MPHSPQRTRAVSATEIKMAETKTAVEMTYTAEGPYIVWEDLGYEGYHPRSFKTLQAAVSSDHFGDSTVITKLVQFDVVEREESA